ncbi:inositol 2-dehydrogenase [Rhizobiales bacterium RZME27]|uniref:Inositol 2-dehydrogenase n=1 Tax=Endobacterium cereale TaxID=2663029 RepID=A0A6A8AJF0_9HYPH|nr:inositol 2-dehydrogenase [Endobacterium cereale]MEB2847458.1 inositol 2-dehydrogenase [Endobacterium cereale]MQY49306.1 inositol 2-dehydrogenase [Endobacterium cereale]
MLKIGLLGAGRIGRVHAINIAAHARSQLAAVSDVNEDSARSLADAYGANVATSEDILSDASIDAVLIATSTDTHSDLMERAAAAGKAILCEKPVDLSLERAQACLDVVSKTGVPVMIGFNRRFDPNFSAIKASIAAGEIGKPELLSITSFDPAPPPVSYVKVSGGLFRDMMIHDFDMANFLMGEVPKTVHAVGTSIVDPEIGKAGDVDTAVVTLTYADGRIAVIKNSRRAVYGYDQRVEILGSEGLLSAGNVLENTVSKATKQGVVSAKPEFFFLERYMRAYAAEWEAFVAAVLDGAAIPVSLKDGVAALALAEAATASVKSGQPVSLA